MNKKIENVVFMGTPDFAAGILRELIRSGYHVSGVFSQPDKPKGRSGKPAPTPVKEAALEEGIPVFQPVRIRSSENLEILRTLTPDVIVVAAFGQIIPADILTLPPYGCINVHASLLPKYRGAAPIQRAIIDGETESGVTTMQMGEGLDNGDILQRCVLPLEKEETGGSLFERLEEAGAKLLIRTLKALETDSIVLEKQPEQSPTPYAAMITKADGKIDWNSSAVRIERLVRGLDPWPSAYTKLSGKQLKIWKSRVAAPEEVKEIPEACPGTVIGTGKKEIYIQTGSGVLAVLELQLEGKKRMASDAFLRGYSLETGTLLGEV